MAKCEEGYLCEVCGRDVERLRDSGLYLQFLLGWIDPETLHTHREVHIECLPALAQFIEDERFEAALDVPNEFRREHLDRTFVKVRAEEVTRAYQRLCQLDEMPNRPPVTDYLLPQVAERWRDES